MKIFPLSNLSWPVTVITAVLFAACSLFSFTAAHASEAPAFTIESDDGTLSIGDHRNQVVYLDFWASWCGPCRQSFPWMNEMQARYGDKGFKVIAINLDDERENAERFLSEVEANFTIGYDPEGKTAEMYDLRVMPSSYLIDRDGNLVLAHKGFKTRDRTNMESRIRELVTK